MKFVPERASRFVGRQKLKMQTNSPTILLGVGITGVIATTVLASRATLKAQPVMEATTLELDRIEYESEQPGYIKNPDPRAIAAAARKQRMGVYTTTAVQLTKLYAPAVVVGSLSVACLVKGHNIQQERYSALSAAYVGLQETFDRYRKRIREEVGEERERELYYDVEEVSMIENGPNGPKKVKKKVVGPDGAGPYARFFGPDNENWKTTPEYNTMWLRQVESYLNTKLRTDGHLFLNRAYEELGIPDSEEGAVVGWLYERGTGDNVVDFGIWDETERDRMYDFMVGNTSEILIDFNVDGPIHKKLKLPKVH
jgi:hypothetical protein